jgi:1-acyl-sn-glycerol-3-phosphate acyltransferase
MSDFSFRLGTIFFRVALRALSEIHIEGLQHVPARGGCLLMANHISHLDPMLLGMNVGRSVDYMADAPLMNAPVLGTILRSWNAFPIDRNKADRRAVKIALQRLKNGRLVGIFPERGLRYGKESALGGAELPLGSVALWQMGAVPVLPAVILGSDQFYQWRNVFRRPRILIRYGPLIPASRPDQSREELRDLLVDAWRDLQKEIISQYAVEEIELPRCAQERWAAKS